MKTTEIILIVTALLVFAIRLYRKYVEKNKPGGTKGNKAQGSNSFPAVDKDDDYEPYAIKSR